MAWLTGWFYRKSHVINQQANAGADYQVGIKVYKGSGVDGTEVVDGLSFGKVYCNNHCLDDFGDIRFTDNDGNLLKYWREDYDNGLWAEYWVKVTDNLTDGDVTIYVYYDNSGASYDGDPDDTFIEAIDDEATTVGQVPEGWTDDSGIDCSATVQTDRAILGSKSLKLNDNSTVASGTIKSDSLTLPSYFIIRTHINYAGVNHYIQILLRQSDTSVITRLGMDYTGDYDLASYDGAYKNLDDPLGADSWHVVEMYIDDIANQLTKVLTNGTIVADPESNLPVAFQNTGIIDHIRLTASGSSPLHDAWFDGLAVRKWTGGNEPGHGAWGEEQSGENVAYADRNLALVMATLTISDVIRDANYNPVADCTVQLFRTGDKKLVGEITSDWRGEYSFAVPGIALHFIVAFKSDGTPVFGASDRDIVGLQKSRKGFPFTFPYMLD